MVAYHQLLYVAFRGVALHAGPSDSCFCMFDLASLGTRTGSPSGRGTRRGLQSTSYSHVCKTSTYTEYPFTLRSSWYLIGPSYPAHHLTMESKYVCFRFAEGTTQRIRGTWYISICDYYLDFISLVD